MAFVMETFDSRLKGDLSTGVGKSALVEWRNLLEVLRARVVNAELVQAALDLLPVSAARAYEGALKYVVDETPGTCYSGVESIEGDVITDTTHGVFNGLGGWAQGPTLDAYTSPMFKGSANLFLVGGPGTPFEVGFIQQCTGKSQEAKYGDVKRQVWYTTLNFPVGDCSSSGCVPFYHRYNGPSHGCDLNTQCVWKVNGEAGHSRRVQMTDYFNLNTFPSRYYHGPNNSEAWCTSFDRKQDFTCWLARRIEGTGRIRLFYQTKYRLAINISLEGSSSTTHRAKTVSTALSSCNSPLRILGTDDSLPIITNPIMNGMDQFQWA